MASVTVSSIPPRSRPASLPPRARVATLACVLSLLLLLCALPVFALQVSPASKRFTSEPGDSLSYQLRILNDQHADLDVRITVEGALSERVRIEPATLRLYANESERNVLVTIALPNDSETLLPGDNPLSLTVSGVPLADGQFGGAVSLRHAFTILRLYDGSFVLGTLRVPDAAPGEPFALTLSLENRGNRSTLVDGEVLLLSLAGSVLGRTSLPSTALGAASDGKLEQRWTPPSLLAPGRYLLDASYRYDDRGNEVERTAASSVRVGVPSIVLGARPANATPGAILRLEVPALLQWNEPVESVATAVLLDGDSLPLFSTTSSRISLLPASSGAFTLFLEVPPVRPGNYTVAITAYDAKSGDVLAQKAVSLTLLAASSPWTNGAVASPLFLFLCLSVLLLFLAAGVWFYLRRRPGHL